MGDGRQWTVPIVRGVQEQDDQLVGYANVPRTVDWDETGKRIVGEVVPQYEDLWAAATKWFDAKTAADLTEGAAMLEDVITAEVALCGIRTNYRIDKAEVGLLKLLDDVTEWAVCDAMIDWPSWQTFLKKKRAQGTSSTAAGPPAGTPATDQP